MQWPVPVVTAALTRVPARVVDAAVLAVCVCVHVSDPLQILLWVDAGYVFGGHVSIPDDAAETACIAAGIGFNGYGADGQERWYASIYCD